MLIDFNALPEIKIPGMNGGTGEMSAKMFGDPENRIILCHLHPGGSIGLHRHENGEDINYVLSGKGRAICDGETETLTAGTCHICKIGSAHSIENTGGDNLVLLTVVVSRQ